MDARVMQNVGCRGDTSDVPYPAALAADRALRAAPTIRLRQPTPTIRAGVSVPARTAPAGDCGRGNFHRRATAARVRLHAFFLGNQHAVKTG